MGMSEYEEFARAYDKAENELGVEHWVYVSYEIRNKDYTRNVLHTIDIPREMIDRWRWLIRWREARLICQHPRENVHTTFCYYDKKTGLDTGFGSLLNKVISAKAQITKVKNRISQYVNEQKFNNLFYGIEQDHILQKAQEKLKSKEANYAQLYRELKEKVEAHRSSGEMFPSNIGVKNATP